MVRDTAVPKLHILSSNRDVWVAIARIELAVSTRLRPLAALGSGYSGGLGSWG